MKTNEDKQCRISGAQLKNTGTNSVRWAIIPKISFKIETASLKLKVFFSSFIALDFCP